MSELLNIPSPYQIRAELETAIINDLLGPAGGESEEIKESRVSDRYFVGLLAPKKRSERQPEEQPETQDTTEIADSGNSEEGTTDSTVPPVSSTMFPSSVGLTFCVDSQVDIMEIHVSWGRYEREDSENYFNETTGLPQKVWKRYPMGGKTQQKLTPNKSIHWVINPEQSPEVYLDGKIKRLDNQDWIISLFLINAQSEPNQNRDRAWLFQPEIKVKSINNTPIFVRTPVNRYIADQEEEAMAMLYRNHVEFATGHGISVHAETCPDNPQKALILKTSVIPRYEVAKTTPPKTEEIPELQGLTLDMKELATSDPQQLQILAQAYQSWINQQLQKLTQIKEYQEIGTLSLAQCQRTQTRIETGINTLIENSQAREAFHFMNEAMYQQRLHSIYSEKKRRGENIKLEDIDIPKNRSWYPFQLAFILLNIPSLTNLEHTDRSNLEQAIADLLWFPTGGGKTEAYLGIAAYTMGIRRLQGVIGDRHPAGVTVLMRYTLRLLTLQQFQRATTLICACENIRRQNPDKWGQERFSIGLWVGGSTPNYTKDSEDFVLNSRKKGQSTRGGSPHQLTNCPWCGTAIDIGKNIHVETYSKGRGRTIIKCNNFLEPCPFSKSDGLPIFVVDEEIYRSLPTLLIATVDKFAQMTWKGPVQMLFGRVDGYCPRHGFRSPDLEDENQHKATGSFQATQTLPHSQLRPPDLIIQDELHLISGPLGSLVGLYETAVDYLCSWELNGKKIYPKIIASTATIKQAHSQVKQVFSRQLQIFPPQGIDVSDNFFSRQRPTTPETPGRLYLGICAQGRRVKAATIRVYLAAMASAQYLYEKYGESVDPWMTLVGYFNSVRELGGTRRLVDDDITIRLSKMVERGLANRTLREIDELTSRKDSTQIPELLDRLEIPFNPKEKKTRPLDVVLATNMISVGVDVKRLGIMVVCGQPKNTAEYIQATSRVGRTYPGLVITLYNWARPRDLSHYERFEHYHATFYQQVEALSVTPFASGATYRGLAALLISLVRLSDSEFNANSQAGAITQDHPLVQQAIDAITSRAHYIENPEKAEQIRRELITKLNKWLEKAQNLRGGAVLKYKADKDGKSIGLLKSASGDEWDHFTCLNSLRNVEPSIALISRDNPPKDDFNRPWEFFHK